MHRVEIQYLDGTLPKGRGKKTEAAGSKLGPTPVGTMLKNVGELGVVERFTWQFARGVHHFNSNARTIRAFRSRAIVPCDPRRSLAFLMIFEAVSSEYRS
jgi:hypothetical protein